MHRRFTRIHPLLVLLLAASLMTLSACGFRLRGQVNLNVDSLYVNTPGSSPQAVELRRILRSNGIRIADSEKSAQGIIDILNEKREESVLSFTPSGTAREVELRYSLQYRVRSQAGEELIAPRTLEARRELLVTAGVVLPQEAERQAIYRDMQSDAVAQLVRQLEFVRFPGPGNAKSQPAGRDSQNAAPVKP